MEEKEMKRLNLLVALMVALTITMPASLTFATANNANTSVASQTEKININTSTEEALIGVPGIGPKTAQKIQAYKKENGNFSAIEDLVNVKGIGEKSFRKMKPYLTI